MWTEKGDVLETSADIHARRQTKKGHSILERGNEKVGCHFDR